MLVSFDAVDGGIVGKEVPHGPAPLDLMLESRILERLGHRALVLAARRPLKRPDDIQVGRKAQAVGSRHPNQCRRPRTSDDMMVEIPSQRHAVQERGQSRRIVANALELRRGGRLQVTCGLCA